MSTYGLQLRVDPRILGRVMAGDFAIVTLVVSLTSLGAGVLSSVVGVRWAITSSPRAAALSGTVYLLATRGLRARIANTSRSVLRQNQRMSDGHTPPMDDVRTAQEVERVFFELRRVIVGQSRLLERLLVGLLARGHCLLESVPGLAKTLAAETLAHVAGGTFARIQFTPDLLPSDIVGTRIYRGSTERFDVELGPVFVNFLLADEINRAPAKVQSALLEVMAEGQVTIGGQTHAVPQPFFVVATQNPIESEGVYQLPDAQRDRFMMKIVMDHPSPAEEMVILDRMAVRPPVTGPGDRPRRAGRRCSGAATGCSSTAASPSTRSTSSRRPATPTNYNLVDLAPHDRPRRQPPRHARPRARRPGAGPDPRAHLRHARRTSSTSPPRCSATACCSPTTPSPATSPPTTSSTGCSSTVPATWVSPKPNESRPSTPTR